jgi:hypothetical protein
MSWVAKRLAVKSTIQCRNDEDELSAGRAATESLAECVTAEPELGVPLGD